MDTAPPLVTVGSRNSGLTSAAFFCRRGDWCFTRAGFPKPFVFDTTGVTPKADAARQVVAVRREKSFMVALNNVRVRESYCYCLMPPTADSADVTKQHNKSFFAGG